MDLAHTVGIAVLGGFIGGLGMTMLIGYFTVNRPHKRRLDQARRELDVWRDRIKSEMAECERLRSAIENEEDSSAAP
jgi:hypothetical protein